MSELQAYCDESGIHDGAAHCLLVGFVGIAHTWRKFESEWARASGCVLFHGNRFFARDGRGRRVGPDSRRTDRTAGLNG